MKNKSIEEQLKIIRRGAMNLVTEDELVEKLKQSRPLRVKLGMDPTAPDIHLGHSVVLRKMRQFQDLGHKGILIIGDYTALIGDPSGASKTRPMLTGEQIKQNAKTYFAQAGKILDTSEDKLEVRYNSEWLSKLTFADVIKLAANITVARMLERDTFEQRFKAGIPIGGHEFLYPLMQGYDSVMVDSDVELGGTDQTFNNLVGRDLQRSYGKKQQIVLTMPLLVGTDGVQKMSKSYGNYIGITEIPREIFGKVMSISDDLMWNYYELLSDLSSEEIEKMKEEILIGRLHPKIAKESLAMEIVEKFHSEEAAELAREEFERMFSKKGRPDEIEEFSLNVPGPNISVVDVIVNVGFCKSKSEARRLISQRAVEVDDKKIDNIETMLPVEKKALIKVGKRKFANVKFHKS